MSLTEREAKAHDGLLKYYNGLTIPQLAFYHGTTKRVAAALRDGAIKPSDLGAGLVWRDRWSLGAIGSGKSVGGLFATIAYSAFIPGNEGVIVRKRWEELKNHLIPALYELLAADFEMGGVGIDPYSIMSKPRAVGAASEIIVRTAGKESRIILKPEPDGPDRFIEDSFKGPEYGWFLLDEMTQLREITWMTLTGRLRRPNIPSHLRAGMAMGNPPVENHWVHDKAQEMEVMAARGERPDICVVRSTMDDNPHLDPDYVKRMKRQYRDDPIGYAMYIEGQDGIHIEGKPVFGNTFKTKSHVDDELKYNPFRPMLVGLDFGYHHPAAVFFQIDDRGRINVLGELLGESQMADEFAEDVWDYLQQKFPRVLRKNCKFFGDPAGAQQTDKGDTTLAILAKKGIRVGYRHMPIEPGLNQIRGLLKELRDGRPRIVMHPRCKNLIRAMIGGYHYARGRDGAMKPEPKKDGFYDHLVDAFRYGITNAVGTYREPRSVSVAGKQRKQFRNPQRGPQFAKGMTPAGLSEGSN